jgi:UDP-N-acetylglucosamine 4,6-dehydratase
MAIDWQNKVVLITGGTGSFGQKMVKTLLGAKVAPRKIIVFSRDEMKQYEMQQKLHDPDKRVRFFIGDIRDAGRLKRAFHGVDHVIHAAAIKIVPTAEYNPFETVQTNVIGAENVINTAIDAGVEKVVALSTDKAANPINLYGATKLCAEKMFVAGNNYSPAATRFSVVRYGNVFGSRGSVVPFFKKVRHTGVVPITDERMTRFWITLEQGVNFVLRSLEEMQGGEVFIPKIPSLRILDLADVLCPDCKREIVGIRPGEKLHETLLSAEDGPVSYEEAERYITYSPILPSRTNKGLRGKPLGTRFGGYRSDNNSWWLDKSALGKMIADEEAKEDC